MTLPIKWFIKYSQKWSKKLKTSPTWNFSSFTLSKIFPSSMKTTFKFSISSLNVTFSIKTSKWMIRWSKKYSHLLPNRLLMINLTKLTNLKILINSFLNYRPKNLKIKIPIILKLSQDKPYLSNICSLEYLSRLMIIFPLFSWKRQLQWVHQNQYKTKNHHKWMVRTKIFHLKKPKWK